MLLSSQLAASDSFSKSLACQDFPWICVIFFFVRAINWRNRWRLCMHRLWQSVWSINLHARLITKRGYTKRTAPAWWVVENGWVSPASVGKLSRGTCFGSSNWTNFLWNTKEYCPRSKTEFTWAGELTSLVLHPTSLGEGNNLLFFGVGSLSPRSRTNRQKAFSSLELQDKRKDMSLDMAKI